MRKTATGFAQHHSFGTSQKSGAGFSAVELLIVFSILALMFAIIVGGITSFAVRQSFKTTVVDVRDGIIDARQRTLASVDDTVYGVHVSSTAAVFFEGVDFVEGDPDNTVITFPNSVTAAPTLAGGTSTATFTRLTGIPSATGTIVLSDSRSGDVESITIWATGLVE